MSINKIWDFPYAPHQDLSLHHFEQLTEGSGLRLQTLNRARPFSLNARFVKETGFKDLILDRLNLRDHKGDLLIFPYSGYENVFRVRFDDPVRDKEDKSIRYKQPQKQRNVPYYLAPQVSRYEDVIFITEGEKKTLALFQAGCNVYGFGGVWNWKDKASPNSIIPDLERIDLKGKTLAIVFDSDIASNKNVLSAEDQFTEYCLSRGASKVLRVRIPSLAGQKMGIDDYLKDHDWNVIDDLLASALVEQGFISGSELIQTPLEPSSMLTRFLPERSFVLIAGVPGAGKTEFLIQQATEAAKQGLVLYYLNEGGKLDLQARLKAYCRDHSTLDNLKWELRRFPAFSEPNGIMQFEMILKTYNPKVVFIDPGPDAFREENEASELKELLAKLYRLKENYNVCLILSWHFSKAPSFVGGVYSFRGSSAIAGKMDAMYSIMLGDGNKRYLKLDKLRLDCPELHQGQKWIIDIAQTDTGKELRFIGAQEALEARYERKQELLSEALSKFEPDQEYSSTKIIETLIKHSQGSFKKGTAKEYLRDFEKNGFFTLRKESRGRNAAVYLRTNKEINV